MKRASSTAIELTLQVASLAVALALWQLVTSVRPDWAFFVGSPTGVVSAAARSEILERLPSDTFVTASQAIVGFVIGTATGTIVGLLLWFSRTVFAVTRPYVIFIASIPIFALGPIFVFWFGTGFVSKVVLVVVATFGLAVVQAYNGAMSCDPNLLRLGRAFGATRAQLFDKLIVPSSIAAVLSGARTNISLALVASVVGEMISSRQGLGNLLIVAEGLYNINLMLACVFLIAGLAIVLNSALAPVEAWASRSRQQQNVSEFRAVSRQEAKNGLPIS